jgi:type II secretory pathway component PulM
MNPVAIEKASERLRQAAAGRPHAAAVEAALERARDQVESLAATAAELEATLPAKVGDALQDGLREQVLPVARHLAEVRGLSAQLVRRLERIEGDLLAERHARVDDLGLLIDLVTSGWKSVDERLAKLEHAVVADDGAVVYRIDDRRTGTDS